MIAAASVGTVATPTPGTPQTNYLPLVQQNMPHDFVTASDIDLITTVLTYLHQDHLGNTVLETSATGAATTDLSYYVYGRQRDTGPVATEHKFTAQKLDPTGLYYFNTRYG